MKFLIDECLSTSLVESAVEAGFPESAHVAHRNMAGWSDPELMRRIIEEDWTLVTRNSDDFRPRAGSSSKAPCYLRESLHAGLVCLNLPNGSGRDAQIEYFDAALAALGNPGDLTNEIIEGDPDQNNQNPPAVKRYRFPEEEQ